MYRKFDVTGNILFAQCFFFFEELNTAITAAARLQQRRGGLSQRQRASHQQQHGTDAVATGQWEAAGQAAARALNARELVS
jgi:hypothetical protein